MPTAVNASLKSRFEKSGTVSAGATAYVEVDPKLATSIILSKGGNSCTVGVCIQSRGTDDAPLTNLEDSDALFSTVSSGTTDYAGGPTKGIHIVKFVNAAGISVSYCVNQN